MGQCGIDYNEASDHKTVEKKCSDYHVTILFLLIKLPVGYNYKTEMEIINASR